MGSVDEFGSGIKMEVKEDPELASSYGHTKKYSSHRATLSEKDLKTSRQQIKHRHPPKQSSKKT